MKQDKGSRKFSIIIRTLYHFVVCYEPVPDIEETSSLESEQNYDYKYCGSPVIANRKVRRSFHSREKQQSMKKRGSES